MNAVVEFLREGAEAELDASGLTIRHTFFIPELTGDPEFKVQQALRHPSIPNFGAPNRADPSIYVSNISAREQGGGALVTVTYSPPSRETTQANETAEGSGEVEIDCGTSSEETITDINGNKMVVGVERTGIATVTTHTAGKVQVERPQLQISISRNEPVFPLAKAKRFTGAINSVPWNGDPPKVWLCRGIRGRTNGSNFRVDYSFVYNAKTWQVVINASELGIIPLDAEENNGGIKRFDVYPLEDFGQLGVSI